MTCTPLELSDGTFAIVCSRGKAARRRCVVCKTNEATRLCDAPKKKRWPDVVVVALDAARSGRLVEARKLAGAHRGAWLAVERAAAGEELTCSRGLCERCSVSFDGEQDLCPPHASRAFMDWACDLVVAGVDPAPACAGVHVELRARQGELAWAPALEVV